MQENFNFLTINYHRLFWEKVISSIFTTYMLTIFKQFMTEKPIQLSSYDFVSPDKETMVSLSSPSQSKLSNKSASTEMFTSQILICKGQTIKDVKMIFCFTDFWQKDQKLTKEVRRPTLNETRALSSFRVTRVFWWGTEVCGLLFGVLL